MATLLEQLSKGMYDQSIKTQADADKLTQTYNAAKANANPVISASALAPASPMPITAPKYDQPYDISGMKYELPPDMEMTQGEKTADDLSTQIINAQNELLGKSSMTAEEENKQGLPAMYTTRQDLTNQFNLFQNEYKALQNQYQYTIPNQMQLLAEGKGMTAGGLAPLTASELRKNQIKQGEVATRSLGIAASLEAINGNIATAQSLVDRAVKQAFGDKEEKLAALKSNLEIILKSPSYTLQDKNRAQKQAAIIKQQEDQLAQQKQDKTDILNMVNEVARLGATPDVLEAMRNADTPSEATQIAANSGVFTRAEDIAMAKEGYVKISGPSQLKGLKEDQILRMPNGDIYKKPPEKINTGVIQTYINGVAHSVLYDTQTGKTIKDLGVAESPSPSFGEKVDLFEKGIGIDSSGNLYNSTVSIPAGTLAYKNNNPGNLRFVGQAGASQGVGGFARFETPEAGYQALISQINLDSSRGLTLSQFINKYAPPSENNTGLYIQQAQSALGVSANTPISQIDINQLAQFMAKKESGTTIKGGGDAGGLSPLAKQVADGTTKLSSLTPTEATKVQKELADAGIKIEALDEKTLARVDKVAGQFDNEQVVKNFSIIAEGYNFANSLPNNTNSPSDDQALIYAFAKAMDPNSVVREGEYATVQKYSQSWLESFKFNAQRTIDNSEFLTQDARKKMKETIAKKYDASLKNYNQVYNEYGRRINGITGKDNGTDYITDYRMSGGSAPDDGLTDEEAYEEYKKIIGQK